MRVDKSKQGWIFGGDAGAEAVIKAAGAQHITRIPETWRDAVKLTRPGDEVYVWVLVHVPTRRGEDDLPPVAQVYEFVREIEARGGVLIEVYSGRRSDRKAEKSAMIADAVRSLKTAGRRLMPPGQRKPGRRERAASKDEIEQARAAWFNRDFETNEVAERYMPEGWTHWRARRKFGVSGRPWPSKKRRKR